MNTKKRNILPIVYILIILLLFCSSAQKERVIKTDESNKKFLITCVSTDFKNALLAQLIERYKNKFIIEIFDLKKLEAIDPGQYSVILIMDSTRAFTLFNRKIRNFMDRVKNPKKVIVFLTAGRTRNYKFKGVDAITSASSKESKQDSFKRISDRIDKISKGT